MRSLKAFALFAALITVGWVVPKEASAQQVSVSFQLFYDELSPYGMWVEYPDYGYVWMPNEDPGFSPYATAGHWVFTEDGWTWFSDYPWGWAPFHYGRWDYDDMYGWFWIPDNEWGPAWVSWRRSPGYYGWAPLRPGISITMVFGRDYRERNERWIFVRDRDITRSDIDRRYINRRNNGPIIDKSTLIENTRRDDRRNVTYSAGPDRDDVQRVTRTRVQAVTVRENDRPGHRLDNRELHIYRPQVQRSNDTERNPAPPKVMRLKDVRPASERNSGKRQQDVRPGEKNRPPQQIDVEPSGRTGKDQQQKKVTQPKKNDKQQSSKSEAKRDEKQKGKRDY